MGLIHRDIKPANILVERNLEISAKLTDFGLARAADDANLTQSGLVAGTPMYMSPEQARGDEIDARSDLFSLGSVLYVMTSGRPPFRASTPLAVMKRVDEDTPRAIREIIPETPHWLCQFIAKLHAKNPAERFQSAREVAKILSECLVRIQQLDKLKDFSQFSGSESRSTMPRSYGRPGWWIWSAAAFMLLFLGVAVATLFSPRKATTVESEMAIGDTAKSVALDAGKGLLDSVPPKPLPGTFENTFGIKFNLISKGKCWVGGGGGRAGSKVVNIQYDLYLGVYEVTQEEWGKVMGPLTNPSRFSRTGERSLAVAAFSNEDLKRFPVDGVSWDDCQEFIKKLNERTKEPGWTYRLPTSDEWEYACREGPLESKDGAVYDFYFDQPSHTDSEEKANYNHKLERTCKVGSYPPNRLGLYDMHGNVFEYCDDTAKDNDSLRLIRGGAWMDPWRICRARNFGQVGHSFRYEGGGLRLARVSAGEDKK